MSRAARIAVSLFIVAHLTAILAWAVPVEFPGRAQVNRLFRGYLFGSGLWQGWDMFAPDPLSINAYLEAEVTFADGRRAIWEFPRLSKLGPGSAYFEERYRKWAIISVRADENAALWPDTARYVARLHADAGQRPQSVKLIRHWAEIPHPAWPDEQPRWSSEVFFTYRVQPEDLGR